MLRGTIFLASLACAGWSLQTRAPAPAALGPRFTRQPARRVQYGAGAGAALHCAAAGQPPPALAWLSAADDSELQDEPGLWRVFGNGTLRLLPAAGPPAARARPAPRTLRCRATNAHGTTLSADITLEPVEDAAWEPELQARGAAAGGVAALSCRAAPAAAPLDRRHFYCGDRLLAPDALAPDSRYIVAGDTLLIRDASPADVGAYSCLARHAVTGVSKRSRPALLSLTGAESRSAPRLLPAPGEVTAEPGAPLCLPCVAPDQPPPHYTWYREREGRLRAVGAEGEDGARPWAGGAALCGRAAPAMSGAWLCKARNAYGDATLQVRVRVRGELAARVSPAAALVPAGGTARLTCAASDPTASLQWLRDGRALPGATAAELVLRDVTRADRGVYQCRASALDRRAIATTELRLGDSPPELRYAFIEQALRGGGAVSLRCAAAGSPAPRLRWLLDDAPLDLHPQHRRYVVSSESDGRDGSDAVSTLNITEARAEDGGRYTCRATNRLGRVDHSARLDIYGPVSIRALGPVRVLAGANATVHCPYSGYPISSVTWRRRGAGAGAALAGSGRVAARGAALRLTPALAQDAGHYACAVAAPHGPPAHRDIEIQVQNPPKISPFMFSSELTEGSSAQVLCGVSSGDKPLYFSWTKDAAPLPADLQIEEKSLNDFSLLMFSELTARHSGEYACRVSNHAASANFSAELSVKVAPAWSTEPVDAAVLLGAPALFECAAKGYPVPTVTWYMKIDETGLGPESERWEQVGNAWGGAARTPLEGGLDGRTRVEESGVRVRDGVLTTPAATRRDQGVYRCTADNGVGPSLNKHVNLTVREPANFKSSVGNVSSVRGQSASLSCSALGDAPLAVYWSHRGTRLDLNSYRWTVSEIRTGEGLHSTLQLRSAERADAGEYRCHAHNQYGRSEVLMFLHIDEPPEPPVHVRLGGVGSRWVRVAWGVAWGVQSEARYSALCTALHALPGAEPPHATFNLTLEPEGDVNSDADRFRTLAAKLESLRPAAAYSLRIVAENHVGRSPHSEPLMFSTLEEPPSAPPQNVRVTPVGSEELHVSWSAPVQDSWNGELLGFVATWQELGRWEGEGEGQGEAGRLSSPGWSSGELTLSGLRGASRYSVAVRAYNRAGAGPASPALYATTADGVPEDPPESVTCEPTSSRKLVVRWARPPAPAVYDVHCAALDPAAAERVRSGPAAARGPAAAGELELRDLAPGTNHSVWVRAGSGPPSEPVYCVTDHDAPAAVRSLRALAAGADSLVVAWLPPPRAPPDTRYALRVAGGGAERTLRVAGGAPGEEVARTVRGLRAGAPHAVRVLAEARAGAGPASRPLSATPAEPGPARVWSPPRELTAPSGARVRLACGAVGAAPLHRRWSPLPPTATHSVTDAGDLIILGAEPRLSGNYTCAVRNAAGADAVTHALRVLGAPAAPAPRVRAAGPRALRLSWDPPPPGSAPALAYLVTWTATGGAGGARRAVVPGGERAHTLRRLPCGARYAVALQARGAAGDSPPSATLHASTEGGGSGPAPAGEFAWANSTTLRFNLLAWRARCAAPTFRLALRPAGGRGEPAAPWLPLAVSADGESAAAVSLRPGAWYEVRARARSPSGEEVVTHYRVATRASSGERIGEAALIPEAGREEAGEAAGGAAAGGAGGAGGAAPAAWLGGALAALLAALAGAALVRRRAASCARAGPPAAARLPGLGERNGKTFAPPAEDPDEISPYATFSMSGGGRGAGACSGSAGPPPPRPGRAEGVEGVEEEEGGGCALHLLTFGRAEELDLAAPPPRPNLISHPEYGHGHGAGPGPGRGRDSDSESSGSPCAACALQLYRVPAGAAPPPARAGAEGRGPRRTPRRRRAQPAPAPALTPTVRYFQPPQARAREIQGALAP